MSESLERAVREHREALASTLQALAQVGERAWTEPGGDGKWTPAQIGEHLALAYEAALRDLAGEGRLRPRVGPVWQRLLRWFLLPHALFHRTLPRVRAPRETRPESDGLPRAAALERLRTLGERFEAAARRAHADGRTLFHPYFGELTMVKAVRFLALHLEHHRRQLPV